MTLQQELLLRTSNVSLKDIALLMGYTRKRVWGGFQRIQRVLADRDLGLDAGLYDLKYSDREFLVRLCQVLGVNGSQVSGEIERISDEIFRRKNLYKPWIFVDTDFQRKEQPLFVLAFIENFRRIQLPELAGLPVYQQVKEVRKLVVRHYKDNDGRLLIWGEIRRYWFHYDQNRVIEISHDGALQNGDENASEGLASVSVKGKNLFTILPNT